MRTAHTLKRTRGYSMAEVGITMAILAVAVVIAVPSLNRASANSELKDSALALDGGLSGTRGEAIRTGDVHLFFLFQEVLGLLGSALAGIFMLGVFTRKVNATAALTGAIACLAAVVYAKYYTDLNFYIYPLIGIPVCVFNHLSQF